MLEIQPAGSITYSGWGMPSSLGLPVKKNLDRQIIEAEAARVVLIRRCLVLMSLMAYSGPDGRTSFLVQRSSCCDGSSMFDVRRSLPRRHQPFPKKGCFASNKGCFRARNDFPEKTRAVLVRKTTFPIIRALFWCGKRLSRSYEPCFGAENDFPERTSPDLG